MPNTAYEALRTDAAWIDETDRGKLRVTGEDAGRLLHAMTTNHVQDLTVGSGVYAFFLTDKGRIMADANIFRLEDSFWLDTEPETAGRVQHHLDKYIIADDAQVENETKKWFAIGIEGPKSDAAMEALKLPIPVEPLGVTVTDWGHVARVASTGKAGFRIWANESKQAELWDQLVSSSIPQALPDDVKIVRLENGSARFGEDITERYLVQETQALNAVHFNKGCYLGQEIVERVRSRGQVHRLLTKLNLDGIVPASAGTKLVLAHTEVGEITSSAYSPALGHVVALGYIRSEVVESRADMIVAGTDPEVRAHVA